MFKELLDEAGIRKVDLARLLGIAQWSVYRWKDKPPTYVIAYLNLLIHVRGLECAVKQQ